MELLFIYLILATPFLTWAFFKYGKLKKEQVYFSEIQAKLEEHSNRLVFLELEKDQLENDINSIRLKVGLSGKEKNLN